MRTLLLLVIACLLALRASAADVPDSGRGAVIDGLPHETDPAAREAWVAQFGTSPVSIATVRGQRALKMPCSFAAGKLERACWDRSVKLDLTGCRGVRLRVLCQDASPISGFNIYFQSGDGWYAASFAPQQPGEWNTITVNKEDTRIEGTPAGWGHIRAIRISAWRAQNVDTTFYLGELAEEGGSIAPGRAGVAIVRAESLARTNPRMLDADCNRVQSMAMSVCSLGLEYTVVSDLDLAPEHLRSIHLAVLPNGSDLPDATTDALTAFVKGDGKLLAFYGLPARLAEAVGMQGGEYLRENPSGQFSSIRFADGALPGAPPIVQQHSWNIRTVNPTRDRARVLSWWHDAQGQRTQYPAIVASDRCVYMSHVLLPDDADNKRIMLLAMMGQLVPQVWREAAESSLATLGQIGPYTSFAEATDALSRASGTAASLASAKQRRDDATALLKKGQYRQALAAAEEARRPLLDAYCIAQKPLPGEHRAFWCHSAFGVAGMTWDQSIKLLADNGFTAIVPNMLWGGAAYYDSKVLPVAADLNDRGDQIAQCLAACRKYGLQIHVWKVNWNMGWNAPKDFMQRMKQQSRTQVSFDGTPNDQWLCPSNPANQQLEIDAMIEVARKYDVDGIHFDYIRYPGPDGCFCPGCRQRFEQTIGHKVANWPADVRSDDALRQQWLDFRRNNITRVVATVADAVHKTRPQVKVSAAVFPNWTEARDSVGQDWKLWCDKGYLDFVCPMDYTPSNAEFEQMVTRQLPCAGKVPCYPGIGLSTWPGPSRDIAKLIDQIDITRRHGTKGFTIFEYGLAESQQIVPACGKGITRAATSP